MCEAGETLHGWVGIPVRGENTCNIYFHKKKLSMSLALHKVGSKG